MAACNWDLVGCDDCDALEAITDPLVRDAIESTAVDMLWNLTGRLYSLCETTVRPCRRECWPVTGLPVPVRFEGQWINLGCVTCPGECSCTTISEALLPGPVDSIVAIMLDGAPLPLEAVRVDNRSRLVRVDGGVWPRCQDLTAPDTEPTTWSVTYLRGTPVPDGGQLAAGTLACELAKAFCGDDGCRLPKRVQTITREAVTVGFIDNFQDLEAGRTGLWEVDSWVASVRHRPRAPKVWSPDIPRVREPTWTP